MLINDAGLTYKILRRAASERDEEAREQWRELIRTTFVASMIVTADESSKDERTIFRKRGCAPSGHRAEIDADFVRGLRYSILAAITIDGYIGTRIVAGSVDGDEFFDFIVNDIVSPDFGRCFDMLTRLQLPQMNKFPNDRSVLILDNCAIHKSEYLREIIEAQGFFHTSLLVNLLICSRLCPSVSSTILAGFQSD
jgi:hypothetical protein